MPKPEKAYLIWIFPLSKARRIEHTWSGIREVHKFCFQFYCNLETVKRVLLINLSFPRFEYPILNDPFTCL